MFITTWIHGLIGRPLAQQLVPLKLKTRKIINAGSTQVAPVWSQLLDTYLTVLIKNVINKSKYLLNYARIL